MGSDSDLQTMQPAADVCKEFGVDYEIRVVIAHPTPQDMADFAINTKNNGISLIIAGAGGAAHLPGIIASHTTFPVIGVPVQSRALNGLHSLLSIVQMPAGVPVATVAIGGGKNTGLLDVSILAVSDTILSDKLQKYKYAIAQESRDKNNNPPFSNQ